MSAETSAINEAGDEAADDPATRPVVTLLPARHKRADGPSLGLFQRGAHGRGGEGAGAGRLVTLRRADEGRSASPRSTRIAAGRARLLDRDAARPIDRRFLQRGSSGRCGCASGSSTSPITG